MSQATRDAALSAVMDREILMLQALAGAETLPQIRRHFTAKYIISNDPDDDSPSTVRGDRYIITNSGNQDHDRYPSRTTQTPISLQRNVIDVHEMDDAGWYRPRPSSGSGSGRGAPGSSASPSPSFSSPSPGQGGRSRMRKRAKVGGGGERGGGGGGGMATLSSSSSSGRRQQQHHQQQQQQWMSMVVDDSVASGSPAVSPGRQQRVTRWD